MMMTAVAVAALALAALVALAWQLGRAAWYQAECERLRGVIAELTQSPEDP